MRGNAYPNTFGECLHKAKLELVGVYLTRQLSRFFFAQTDFPDFDASAYLTNESWIVLICPNDFRRHNSENAPAQGFWLNMAYPLLPMLDPQFEPCGSININQIKSKLGFIKDE